ncbi:hypothetical protein EVAR_50484_1 [Eumeta japonica]|uniref:Uncharacterized protein n=1 Tax=Eumeta variegata TaxID=151549 RepID=A0A4C1XWL6_EUMVA|nr:hypothetical protein EVAR_50484_1 [Eumeta japonica]
MCRNNDSVKLSTVNLLRFMRCSMLTDRPANRESEKGHTEVHVGRAAHKTAPAPGRGRGQRRSPAPKR